MPSAWQSWVEHSTWPVLILNASILGVTESLIKPMECVYTYTLYIYIHHIYVIIQTHICVYIYTYNYIHPIYQRKWSLNNIKWVTYSRYQGMSLRTIAPPRPAVHRNRILAPGIQTQHASGGCNNIGHVHGIFSRQIISNLCFVSVWQFCKDSVWYFLLIIKFWKSTCERHSKLMLSDYPFHDGVVLSPTSMIYWGNLL